MACGHDMAFVQTTHGCLIWLGAVDLDLVGGSEGGGSTAAHQQRDAHHYYLQLQQLQQQQQQQQRQVGCGGWKVSFLVVVCVGML